MRLGIVLGVIVGFPLVNGICVGTLAIIVTRAIAIKSIEAIAITMID